jgi:hypothetical protein
MPQAGPITLPVNLLAGMGSYSVRAIKDLGIKTKNRILNIDF